MCERKSEEFISPEQEEKENIKMDVTGKLIAKAGNGKGFKVENQDGWFNASDAVVPYLAKIEKGEEVTISYEKKGASKIVTKIVKAFSSATQAETASTQVEAKPEKTYTSKGSSGDDIQARIQRGNALNASAAVLSGAGCIAGETPETIAEITKAVANSLLDWLQLG